MFFYLLVLMSHNEKDFHTAVSAKRGCGVDYGAFCMRDNVVTVDCCSISRYLGLDASVRQRSALMNFFKSYTNQCPVTHGHAAASHQSGKSQSSVHLY